jgi:hypothetical protein
MKTRRCRGNSSFTPFYTCRRWSCLDGDINQLCGETPIDLRMRVPAPKTDFSDLSVMLTETEREAAINVPGQCGQEQRKLEEWQELYSQRFVTLGINLHSYNAVVWVTSQFLGALNSSWWLNRRHQAAISNTFDSLFTKSRKTSLLPNIRDDPITAGLSSRVNDTFQQLLRCFCWYDSSNKTNLVIEVEFAYNARRALLHSLRG